MIEIWMGHKISSFCASGAGPFQAWHTKSMDLRNKLETCLRHGRLTHINQLQAAARSAQPHILLTVDDGFGDFAKEVLPLLEHYQIGCIVFLTTGFIDAKLKPYELELARLINAALPTAALQKFIPLKARRGLSRQNLYEQLRLAIKYKPNRVRQDFLSAFRQSVQDVACDSAPNLFLSWDQIREIDRHPLVTIGAHTATHPFLPAVGLREAWREIYQSKRRIESIIGHSIECFSYPYGGHSLLVRILVRLAGFKFAFTTSPQIVTGECFNSFRLPRIDLQQAPAGSGCNG